MILYEPTPIPRELGKELLINNKILCQENASQVLNYILYSPHLSPSYVMLCDIAISLPQFLSTVVTLYVFPMFPMATAVDSPIHLYCSILPHTAVYTPPYCSILPHTLMSESEILGTFKNT